MRVAFAGGSFVNEAFLRRTKEALAELAPHAIVEAPRYDPAVGAGLMAFRDAGLSLPERIVE